MGNSSLANAGLDECVIQGNPDILGIGVRLGIYFRLVANLAIAFIHPDEALGSLAMLMIISVLHSIVNYSISSAELICALWMVVLDFPVIFPIIAIVVSMDCFFVSIALAVAEVVVNFGRAESTAHEADFALPRVASPPGQSRHKLGASIDVKSPVSGCVSVLRLMLSYNVDIPPSCVAPSCPRLD